MFIICIQTILRVKQLYESEKVGIKLIGVKTHFIILVITLTLVEDQMELKFVLQ